MDLQVLLTTYNIGMTVFLESGFDIDIEVLRSQRLEMVRDTHMKLPQ